MHTEEREREQEKIESSRVKQSKAEKSRAKRVSIEVSSRHAPIDLSRVKQCTAE